MKRFIALLLTLFAAQGLFSATPTDTPSFTASPTVTPTLTGTPGLGHYSVSPAAFVSGSTGNSFELTYFTDASSWPSSGGLLTLLFPPGLDAPSTVNFYPAANYSQFVIGTPVVSGQSVEVQVKDRNPGESIIFRYGYNPSGFSASSTLTAETLYLYAYPSSTSQGKGGQLLLQPTIGIYTPAATRTATPTPTITQSQTPNWTATHSPTSTPTFTVTPTWTESPVAPEEAGVFTYPNPYDARKFDKVTVRFPPDNDARVTIFNLAGEPVKELDPADIQGAAGWAIWRGKDDYMRPVPGGLYYVRVRGKNTLVRKFTVLN